MKLLYIDCSHGVTAERLSRALSLLAGENIPVTAVGEAVNSCRVPETLLPCEILYSPVCLGRNLPCADILNAAETLAVTTNGNAAEDTVCDRAGLGFLKENAVLCRDIPAMTLTGSAEYGGLTVVSGEADALPGGRRLIRFEFNVDDMTGEEAGFALGKLTSAGAAEVYTSAVQMKKNRPGILFTVILPPGARENVLSAVFRYTSTAGVRESTCTGNALSSQTKAVETPFGTIRKKISAGYGVTKEKFEYDDLAAAAEKTGASLGEIRKAAGENGRKAEKNE